MILHQRNWKALFHVVLYIPIVSQLVCCIAFQLIVTHVFLMIVHVSSRMFLSKRSQITTSVRVRTVVRFIWTEATLLQVTILKSSLDQAGGFPGGVWGPDHVLPML